MSESAHRACPFCARGDTAPYGRRGGTVFVRCEGCRSILMDLSPEAFGGLHEAAFVDDDFEQRIALVHGDAPDPKTWAEVASALGSVRRVLEIGPGTGHVLAAARDAGCEVWGVESSGAHRALMSRLWGLSTVESFDQLPAGLRFDAAFAINVVEHVYDVRQFLAAVAERLEPGGRFFFSTVNAGAFVARVCGTRWAMFKQPDHVSFPSTVGIAEAARRAGLAPVRIWSGELPFETPVSLLVAWRDAVRGDDGSAREAQAARSGRAEGGGNGARPHGMGRRMLPFVYRQRWIDPISAVLGRSGTAATVKAVLERPRVSA
jgi:SAM-dependent methyltransferase